MQQTKFTPDIWTEGQRRDQGGTKNTLKKKTNPHLLASRLTNSLRLAPPKFKGNMKRTERLLPVALPETVEVLQQGDSTELLMKAADLQAPASDGPGNQLPVATIWTQVGDVLLGSRWGPFEPTQKGYSFQLPSPNRRTFPFGVPLVSF